MTLKSIILAIVIILVIVLAVWYYYASTAPVAPQPTQEQVQDNVKKVDDTTAGILQELKNVPGDPSLEGTADLLDEALQNF